MDNQTRNQQTENSNKLILKVENKHIIERTTRCGADFYTKVAKGDIPRRPWFNQGTAFTGVF